MNGLELILWISEMLAEVAHLINVGLLPMAELSEHVPFKDTFQTLTVHLAYTFLTG